MYLFETERLHVRRLEMGDAEGMHSIYGDALSMEFVGDGLPLPIEACRHWVEVTDRNFKRRGYGMVGAIEKSTGELIACAGIVHPSQQEEPEIKYAIRRDKWGLGFATELVTALVSFAQSSLAKTWLMATVNPAHIRSQSVLTKAGFRRGADRVNEDGSLTQVWTIQLGDESLSPDGG